MTPSSVGPLPPTGQAAARAAAVFTTDFHGYQKMTDADYLEHTILFGAVQSCLKNRQQPLRILDLGCGDCQNLAKLIKALPEGTVASYTGVDMSDSAIKQALSAMTSALGVAAPIFFHRADMHRFLSQTSGSYDVVLAAFSLHHLASDDKVKVLKEIHRLVSPIGGEFVMVDPYRLFGETLDAYHDRATEVGMTWVLMGEERQQTFIKHMQDYDIVESEAFFDESAKAANFASMDVICRGTKGLKSCVTVFRS